MTDLDCVRAYTIYDYYIQYLGLFNDIHALVQVIMERFSSMSKERNETKKVC